MPVDLPPAPQTQFFPNSRYACFLSLSTGFIIRKESEGMGTKLPYEDLMEELKDSRVEWVEVNEKEFLLRDALSNWQKKLFKRFNVKIPSSVLDTR